MYLRRLHLISLYYFKNARVCLCVVTMPQVSWVAGLSGVFVVRLGM